MFRKLVLALVVLALGLGATTVLAGGKFIHVYIEDVGEVPMYADGRINAFDIDSPVGIFCIKESYQLLDEYGELVWKDDVLQYGSRLNRIEFWGFIPGTDRVEKVLEIAGVDVEAWAAGTAVVTREAYGYTLAFDPVYRVFTLTVPAYNYMFSWEYSL